MNHSPITAKEAYQAIETSSSCAVLDGSGISHHHNQPSTSSILDDLTSNSTTSDHVYRTISTLCGQLTSGTFKSTLVSNVIDRLARTNKLIHAYLEDPFIASYCLLSQKKDTGLDSLVVPIHGYIDKFVCQKCTARSQLTQAVLLKTLSYQVVKCEVCGIQGTLGTSVNGSDFCADVLNRQVNEQTAVDMAQSDSIDLLLILGMSNHPSEQWNMIATTLSATAGQIIIIGDGNSLKGIKDNQICTDIAEFEQRLTSDKGEEDSKLASSMTDISLSTNGDSSCSNNSASESTGEQQPQRQQQSRRNFSKGNRNKPNLNHLLNFTLPARVTTPLPTIRRPYRRSNNKNSTSVISEEEAEKNKMLFINANFRFVLKPQFWPQMQEIVHRSDMLLKWKWIERVILPVTGQAISCPICLSPPVTARVTKCGHVYCYPCALRYLSYREDDNDNDGDRDIKKCPICWGSMETEDLLPVHFWHSRYRTSIADKTSDRITAIGSDNSRLTSGSCITMRLMKRLRNTTLCLTSATLPQMVGAKDVKSKDTQLDSCQFPWTFTPDALPFAKFMLADRQYCKQEYDRELDELEKEKQNALVDNDQMAQLFIESAVMSVEESFKSLADDKLEPNAHIQQQQQQHQKENQVVDNEEDDYYCFYQADDGQHIYMHPLDTRVLSQEYGGFFKLPETLTFKIRHAVDSTITQEVRKRFKFLDHLSLRCDVVFVEAELKPLVSHQVFNKHRSQLAQRDKHHAARARHAALDETRSEIMAARAAAAEDQYGNIRYTSEWTRDGLGRYNDSEAFNATKPDQSSFPALGGDGDSEHATPIAKGGLWPRQPVPGSNASQNGGMGDEFWEEFEKAAEAARHANHSHHGGGDGCCITAAEMVDPDENQQYHDLYDVEDFSVPTKFDSKRSAKNKKSKKGLTLVLSGSGGSYRRR